MLLEDTITDALIAQARKAREQAYAPYSGFKVGAEVMGGSGSVYTGCNVENASYGLTVCAERTAVLKAVSEGERKITAVAIAAGEDKPAKPCGACLQVIREFSDADDPAVIITSSLDGSYEVSTINDYLPMPFDLEHGAGE